MSWMSRTIAAVILVTALFTTGCTTGFVYPPRDADSTLVVGALFLAGEKLPEVLEYLKDAPQLLGYELQFVPAGRQPGINVRVLRRIGNSALVASNRLPAGDYQLARVNVTAPTFSGVTISARIVDGPDVSVRPGVVNNLGIITLEFREQGETRIHLDNDYEEIEQAFRRRYAESGWYTHEWEPTLLRMSRWPTDGTVTAVGGGLLRL